MCKGNLKGQKVHISTKTETRKHKNTIVNIVKEKERVKTNKPRRKERVGKK